MEKPVVQCWPIESRNTPVGCMPRRYNPNNLPLRRILGRSCVLLGSSSSALVCSSGCMAARLRQRTINQGSSLPELQYEQVLSNLAMFSENPAALPWHVNLPRRDDATHRLDQRRLAHRSRTAGRYAAASIWFANRRGAMGHVACD